MKRYLTVLAVLGFVLAGCDKKPIDPVPTDSTASITLSETAVAVGPEGGSVQLTVTSSATWRVAGVADWVSVSPQEGRSGETLTVTVAPNPGKEPISTTFKVFADDAVQDLTITSRPVYVLDLLGEEEISVGPDATEVVVSFASNCGALDVSFSDAAWAAVKEQSDALGRKLVKLAIRRSADFRARENTVSFSGEGLDKPVTVKLTQAQRDTAFVVEGDAAVDRIVKGLEAMDLSLTVKSNFEIAYDLPSWLTETSPSRTELDEATGLMTTVIGLHADACGGSRAQALGFRKASGGDSVYGSVYIKQQHPNPVYAEIEDQALARILSDGGWILKDPFDGKTEVLEQGLTGRELSINNMQVVRITGLEVFPELSRIIIGTNTRNVETIDLGGSKVSAVSLGSNHYLNSAALTIAGDNIASITLDCSSWYILYGYDRLETLDVSGCPALTTLQALRQYNGTESPLRTIYMTAAQAESVAVTTNPSAQIVVK